MSDQDGPTGSLLEWANAMRKTYTEVGRYQLASSPVVGLQDGRMMLLPTALRFDTVTGLLEVIEVPRPEEPKIKPAKVLDLPSGRVS